MKRTKPYFENIDQVVIEELEQARSRLLIAVAWLSNKDLIFKLIEMIQKGIIVEIIVDDNSQNRKNNMLKKIINECKEFSFINNLTSSTSLMHNKFCVIDYNTVITGSYNWTKNAQVNNENIVLFNGDIISSEFALEFRKIKFDSGIKMDSQKIYENIEANFHSILIRIIKDKIVSSDKPKKGIIADYSDNRIKNSIMDITEFQFVETQNEMSYWWKFEELIEKYGMLYWKEKSKQSEKRKSEDNYWYKEIKKMQESIDITHAIIKKKAIDKIQNGYTNLISKKSKQEQYRILKVLDYINREKIEICRKYQIN